MDSWFINTTIDEKVFREIRFNMLYSEPWFNLNNDARIMNINDDIKIIFDCGKRQTWNHLTREYSEKKTGNIICQSEADFSINDAPMFVNNGGKTEVSLVCKGKDDLESLKNLPAGTYDLHITAIPKSAKPDPKDPNQLDRTQAYVLNRKTVKLTSRVNLIDF